MKENYDLLNRVEGLNHVALTPISFLHRARDTYPEQPGIVYGNRAYNWKEVAKRCQQLASGLKKLGIEKGCTVAMMAGNTPELAEAHFGVPMSNGVLSAINTRLDADTVAYILEHGDAKALITDTHFSATISAALKTLSKTGADLPIIIDIVDEQAAAPSGSGQQLGKMSYEELLASGDQNDDQSEHWGMPESEWDALSLNYTSGTSGKPKGVVYHHRGAYLMAMGTATAWQLPKHSRYLTIVPMFHCNGWGHVWMMALMGGTLFCNRVVNAENIFSAIKNHRITHFGAAPIVLAMLANAPPEIQYTPDYTVQVMTAGAPPPSKILEKTTQLGFNILHSYGLTETYGHILYCDWRAQWATLPLSEQAEIKSRQGVRFQMMEAAKVIDVDSGKPVPADGETIGEIVLQGNPIMKGYYKSAAATDAAFKDGWFHSGDLAVVHPDGYIEIKDRLKDIIISGGENISSIEIESVLYKFHKVAAAAVVAKPDEKWGESPCAFVELKEAEQATEEEIIAFCQKHLASFKRPKQIVFIELPKTSTGKIQKFKLRQMIEAAQV